MDAKLIEKELIADGLSIEQLRIHEENILKTKNKLVDEIRGGLGEYIKTNPNNFIIKQDTLLDRIKKFIKNITQVI